MEASRPEELRFDFDAEPRAEVSGAHDSEDTSDEATDLVGRVAAVRAVAAQRTRRRAGSTRQQVVVVDSIVEREIETDVAIAPAPFTPGPDEFAPVPAMIEDDEAEEVLTDADSLTVAEFYERVKRALRREFPDEVWVTGEIRGFRESRGHRYLELADVGSDSDGRNAAQQLEVVCWARDWPPVGAALTAAGVDLEVGRVVRVRGKVSVWEGGSKLRFTLTALDVEALLGGIAAARRRLLLALAEEGLLERQKRIALPLVPLRIGVITSPGSEAHRDFVGRLERSGFAFEVGLEPSLVQGAEAPGQLVRALERLASFEPELVVIVRGGGARGDLAAFDNEDVARAIATSPFPIWAGIGHTGDHSVVDEVVHSAYITPTACGEAVVARVAQYWDEIARRTVTLSSLARARLDAAMTRLSGSEGALVRSVRHQLERRSGELVASRAAAERAAVARLRSERERATARAQAVRSAARRALQTSEAELARRDQVLRAFDPRRQFERGWTLTRREGGRRVRSVTDLHPGERLVTRFSDGETTSVVFDLFEDETREPADRGRP